MYLLEIDTGNLIATFVFGTILSLVILYFIIKEAVRAGTKDLKNQVRFQNNLKIIELKKDGFKDEEIIKLRDDTLNY